MPFSFLIIIALQGPGFKLNTTMKLIELLKLTEAPISGMDTIGDFETPGDEDYASRTGRQHSFAHQHDRRIITHPKFAAALERAFSHTDHNFNIVFANLPDMAGVYEVGQISPQMLKANYPELAEQYEPQKDAINIIFVNNQGDERFPMSPWIVAHRISHALGVQQGSGRNAHYPVKEISQAVSVYLDYTSRYLWKHYEVAAPKNIQGHTVDGPKDGRLSGNWQEALNGLAMEIGTFRSARSGSLARPMEFVHEAFAQYLTTGSVKVKAGGKWTDTSDQDFFEEMVAKMEELFEDALHRATNRIFLM